MSKKRIWIGGCILLLILVWLRLFKRSDHQNEINVNTTQLGESSIRPANNANKQSEIPNHTNVFFSQAIQNQLTNNQTEVDHGKDEWKTPINFYGLVIDENSNAVPDADVQFTWTDLSLAGNSERRTKSDTDGRFSLQSVTGKNLIVVVSKEGYYSYNTYGMSFTYAGENNNFVPNQLDPIVFRLKKRHVGERLIVIKGGMRWGKTFPIPKNGAVEISLISGKQVQEGEGDLRVRFVAEDQGKAIGQRFDWKVQVSVPHGGIQVFTDTLNFEAPLDGYAESDEISMQAGDSQNWSTHAKRNYFLHLANGNYARINFEMMATGDHFFEVASFLNPSGSPNLELDPNNVVTP